MEMSPEYADETAQFLVSQGFNLITKTQPFVDTDGQAQNYQSTQYKLTSEHQTWLLEVVTYADNSHRYFLTMEHYYVSTYSLELDSWKYRDEHIEFRYYTNPETGGALTIKLSYPNTKLDSMSAGQPK